MNTLTRQAMLSILTTAAIGSQIAVPAFSQTYYQGHVYKPSTTMKVRGYMATHPKVRGATIGAGVGTAAGAVAGLVSGRGIMRGALIGAGTGAGVGVLRSSQIMRRHPFVKNTATGAVAGLGLGMAAGHGHHSGVKAAAVGGAVGLGLTALERVVR